MTKWKKKSRKNWNLITPNGQHLLVRHEDFRYFLEKTFGDKSFEANKSFCKSGRYGAWVCSNYSSNYGGHKSR